MTKSQIKRRITFLQSIIDKFIKSGRKATRGLKKWLLSIIEKIDRLQAMLNVDCSLSMVQDNSESITISSTKTINKQLSLFEFFNLSIDIKSKQTKNKNE